MVLTLVLTIVAIAFLLYIRHIIVVQRFTRKGKQLPFARKNYPIIGHAAELAGNRNRFLKKIKELIDQSPPIFCIFVGPFPMIILHKPSHLEVIMGSAKHIDKPHQYKFVEPWLGTGLLTSTGTKWHTHRKMITPTFHFKILDHFIKVFAENSQIMVQRLERELNSESFNIYSYVTMCALDIICETAMGIKINAQQQKENDYVSVVTRTSDGMMHRMLSPWLHNEFIFNISPPGRRQAKYVKQLHKFTNEVIQKRKVEFEEKKNIQDIINEDDLGRKKKLAFLDLLLESSQNGNRLTDEEIREEVDTFMFEGHDTTTAGISWTLQMLGEYPDVQEKVYEELENIFQGSDRQPTMKDLNDMKYLEMVIKESLRLYPSVPIIGRELKEDVEIDGVTIPAGIQLLMVIYYTHRDPEHFTEPEVFNPDNFLPDRVTARHPYSYIPFSAGPRNCIGQKFALLEEKMVLSYILRHYKLRAMKATPIGLPELILRPENGIHMQIIKRETSL